MNKHLKEQMDWYSSQPVSYRRMWWGWAATQPNYREMLTVAQATEDDDSVRRMMDMINEQVRLGKAIKV